MGQRMAMEKYLTKKGREQLQKLKCDAIHQMKLTNQIQFQNF
jgi:hypothetical protein